MRSSKSRPVAAFAALLAVWLHALLPPGFMPGMDAGGRATLQLCDGGRLAAGRAFGPPDAPAEAADGHLDNSCAFAMGASLLGPGAAPAVSAPARSKAARVVAPAAPFREVRGAPVGARAPPATVA